MTKPVKITGSIKSIRFESPDRSFYIFTITSEEYPNGITVKGNAVDLTKGATVTVQGNLVKDATWGLQIQSTSILMKLPSNRENVIKYITSNKQFYQGLGEKSIQKIVDFFGPDKIFDILDESPEDLRKVQGLNSSKVDQFIKNCKETLSERSGIRDLAEFLINFGITSKSKISTILKLFKNDSSKAISAIQRNPYILYRAKGIGFVQADNFAKKMGISNDDPDRIKAGIHYILMESTVEGDCAVSRVNLIVECKNKLNVAEDAVKNVLDSNIPDVILDRDLYYASSLYKAETGIVEEISRLLRFESKFSQTSEVLQKIIDTSDIFIPSLTDLQKQACLYSTNKKISILTGGPGTGKTATLKAVLEIYRKLNAKILLASPTGRAAKIASDVTGEPATSIHRLLGIRTLENGNFVFNYDENNKLDADLIVIDEVSMVDLFLMWSLLKAIPDNTNILLVGDVDQLPSVGPGAILQHFIESDRIATTRLLEPHRFALTSGIVTNSHKINNGNMPQFNESDFVFYNEDDVNQCKSRLLSVLTVLKSEGLDLLRDVQILTPMNKSTLGVTELNAELQNLLNPNGCSIELFGINFRAGDKIIQLKNNYQKLIFNGDIGHILSVNIDNKTLLVNFDDNILTLEGEDLKHIRHAYVTTVHKSQGSEYNTVIVLLHSSHYIMLQRNLLYTAVTRGKKRVIVIGDSKAINIAVRTTNSKNRISLLKNRLNSLIKEQDE